MSARGYFEVGIWHGKTPENLGTLWRSAYQLGAAGIFTVGRRWPDKQASDTPKAWRHIPYRKHPDLDSLVASLPYSCPLVGIEMGGETVISFQHPERCCYLLGAEDHGLSPEALERCHAVVSLPAVRLASYNVAVAGSLVMWDRLTKKGERRRRAA